MSLFYLKKNELDVCENLGSPLPLGDVHSVSVNLPKWIHVVGYEQGDPSVISQLTTGYPRFRIHNDVQTLNKLIIEIVNRFGGGKFEDFQAMALANISAVRRLFCYLNGSDNINVYRYGIKNSSVSFVVFPSSLFLKVNKVHTVLILSSG